MTTRLDSNTPILVGCGLVQQKEEDASAAVEPLRLMIAAAERAASDAGTRSLLSQLDRITVPMGRWAYQNPARTIGEAIGSPRAHTVGAQPGVSQQTILSDAATAIQNGDLKTVLIVGGEGGYRLLRARIEGVELVDTESVGTPDELLKPDDPIIPEHEHQRGLGVMAVGYYALIDSAWRHAKGRTLQEHRDKTAIRYQRFSEIAARNTHGWTDEPLSMEAVRDGRMLAFPYTKYHAANWSVDQASALILTSVGEAERLGVPRSKWIFPQAFSEANHIVHVGARGALHRCVGADLAGPAVLDAAGCTSDALDFAELYSCFPIAVETYREALRYSDERDLSFTGAMPFAGGPFNNFVLHSTAQLAEKLREKRKGRGIVTTVSGLLTKQGFAIWGTEPNPNGYQFVDVTSEVARVADTRDANPDYAGPAQVAGYTVMYEKGERACGVIVADLPDRRRSIAKTSNPDVIASMEATDFCGRRVLVQQDSFEPAAGSS